MYFLSPAAIQQHPISDTSVEPQFSGNESTAHVFSPSALLAPTYLSRTENRDGFVPAASGKLNQGDRRMQTWYK